ncbi:N-acetyltransferase family protein [Streptomyces albidus (ex Kaewkla and Franco 2022)]|uniref:GNAT family N-acetyltransferase n=1 Tax=Streptomyces albidus (ex Kaewkla and Franco 2022) TaxID=722709 RepID=UPI003AF32974
MTDMSQNERASRFGMLRLVKGGVQDYWSRLNRRHSPAPPLTEAGAAAAVDSSMAGATSLWQMRTTVREQPGALAALCTALARERIDIVSLQTHPLGLRPGETPSLGLRPGDASGLGLRPGETPNLGLRPGETPRLGLRPGDASSLGVGPGGVTGREGRGEAPGSSGADGEPEGGQDGLYGAELTVDEFVLRAPRELESADLVRLVSNAGGSHTWVERADAHDLVDTPTRVLHLAARTALDTAELPLALRQLLGRCTIRSIPPVSPVSGTPAPQVIPEGTCEETELRLPDPAGGVLVIERPHLPFTPTEFARARALVELDRRLGAGARVPHSPDTLTLPEGQPITVRRADARDAPAALKMHDRCSERTLSQRYHGPVGDADRYIGHLLSPRFGRTLAVETATGKLVALGHLLWDGDETEVALLVEDTWQHRGIGGELLRRLAGLAREAGAESIYAVTQASNTTMVAAMRGLSLPLDFQVEEGTLVVTAQLAGASAPTPVAACVPADRQD